MKKVRQIMLLISFVLIIQKSFAGSATWNANPISNDWNTATNWTPNTVPDGPSDIATFEVSNIPSVSTLSGNGVVVAGLRFDPGASEYTITVDASHDLGLADFGIENDSGVTQKIVVAAEHYDGNSNPALNLFNQASAGDGTIITCKAGTVTDIIGGVIYFQNSSRGGSATIVAEGTPASQVNPGRIVFSTQARADHANIINNGGTGPEGLGATTEFLFSAGAAHATITNNGGEVSGAGGGVTSFTQTATAADASITCNGGSGGGDGGRIGFFTDSLGGRSRITVLGNGTLDITGHFLPGLTIGSLEGDGIVLLGANNLALGSNNLSTTFSGVIDGAGSLRKVGRGQLSLSGGNTYTGGTTVSDGTLLLEINGNSSQTGTGKVLVTAGTIGGNGLVDGPLTIGNGRGRRATLFPTLGSISARILKKLTFNSDGNYNWQINSTDLTTSTVWARGARMANGAQFLASDVGAATIPVGTVLTVISNFATTPITGTFSNLPDGGTIKIGNNTYQANYEGGDGNDLTLTVVP